MRISFARAATRHRISRARAKFVVENCGEWVELPGQPSDREIPLRFLCLGTDQTGVVLEVVVALDVDEHAVVIHAMPMRAKYRHLYEEVKRWEK